MRFRLTRARAHRRLQDLPGHPKMAASFSNGWVASLRIALQCLRYLWAAPYTALGLVLGLVGMLLGGRWGVYRGVMEFHAGALGHLISRLPQPFCFSAMTLGHVILAVNGRELVQLRPHEHVHVRQYERWGPLFLPAYLASSLLQLLRGRDPYRENHFERQAFARAPLKQPLSRD